MQQNLTKLRANGPSYSKSFEDDEKEALCMLFLKYIKRARYGIQGHNYPHVEIMAKDEVIERIFSKLPFKKSDDMRQMQTKSQLNITGLMYDDIILDISTIYLNRKDAKEFFSIFEMIEPKLDQLRICMLNNENVSKKATDEEIEYIFYDSKNFSEQCDRAEEFNNNFKIEKNLCNDTPLHVRRISVLFGYHGNDIPFNLKLVHNKNSFGTGVGELKLCFTYLTYRNGVVQHELPFKKRQEKLLKKGKTPKKRRISPEEQRRIDEEDRKNEIEYQRISMEHEEKMKKLLSYF
jgi:hypothetical protein